MKCLNMTLKEGETVLDVILAAKMAASRSEARRLFDQKGVRLDGETIERGDVTFPHRGCVTGGQTEVFEGEVIQKMQNGLVICASPFVSLLFQSWSGKFRQSLGRALSRQSP